MIYIESPSVLSAVKTAYNRLYPQGRLPYDTDLEIEDSATIVVQNGADNLPEAVSLENGKLCYSFDYTRYFPYADEFMPDIVNYEMGFWNEDFISPPNRLMHVIDHLRSNMQSRRALINLWDGSVHETSVNAPCVTQVWFRVKGDSLEMHSHLRANNVSFLLFMDMQVMSGIHKVVANALDLTKGDYVHFVDSLHCYKKEAEIAKKQYEHMGISDVWKQIR